MMNIYQVNRLLKQRAPFQMVEKVRELVPGESAAAIKTVSINDPWFAGHFPDAPILPGVLAVEACAQVCALTAQAGTETADALYVLLKVDQFKFLKPILPGDVMEIKVSKKSKGGPLMSFDVSVYVDGVCHCKGSLSFTAMDRQILEQSGEERE